MADPAKPPMSRRKKLLFGCLGCFGFAVLCVVVAIAVLVRWLNEVTVPANGDALLGPDTVSIVVLSPDAQDAGVQAFVRGLAQQIDRDRPDAIHKEVREWMQKMGKNDTESILLSFLPITWARLSTRGPLRDEATPVELVSLSRWSNPVAWIGEKQAEERSTSKVTHGGTPIFVWAKGEGTEGIAFLENHVVRGPDAKAIGAALDRLTSAKAPTGLVKELRDRLAPKPHLWGLLVNQGEAASREFAFLEGLPVSSAEVLGIAWEIQVKGAEDARGRFHLKARDRGMADQLDRALIQRSQDVRYALKQEHDIDVTFTQRVDGVWVVLDFEMKDLARRVIKTISEGK